MRHRCGDVRRKQGLKVATLVQPQSRFILRGLQGTRGFRWKSGGEGQNRTVDTTIFSRMLYQLSYLAIPEYGSW